MNTASQAMAASDLARGLGYNPHWMVERFNGKMVEVLYLEPDPNTFRDDYYYNARTNQLFKKITIGSKPSVSHWKPANS